MIFVTVGTHEQPFNRLIQKVDELKKDGVITEDVIIQTGFSTYEPKYCQWSKLIPYQQMIKNVADARIVITHGGPASFIMPLQIGKTPIAVASIFLDSTKKIRLHLLSRWCCTLAQMNGMGRCHSMR